MATIAIGDIHGNLNALRDLLGQLRAQVTADDTVVFLGDYLDRGPDTKGCIDEILRFPGETSARVVCLRGNHEDWFLRTLGDYRRHSWLLGMNGLDTIRSYSAEAALALEEAVSDAGLSLYLRRGQQTLPYDVFFDAVPEEHLSFLANLSPHYQGPDGICSHGGLDPRVTDLHEQSIDALIWGASGFPEDYRGAETVAYGHRDNAELDSRGWPMPKIIGSTIGLDTISHGVLTAMRLVDRRLFQSGRYRVSGK